jgi:hypothetical protein
MILTPNPSFRATSSQRGTFFDRTPLVRSFSLRSTSRLRPNGLGGALPVAPSAKGRFFRSNGSRCLLLAFSGTVARATTPNKERDCGPEERAFCATKDLDCHAGLALAARYPLPPISSRTFPLISQPFPLQYIVSRHITRTRPSGATIAPSSGPNTGFLGVLGGHA